MEVERSIHLRERQVSAVTEKEATDVRREELHTPVTNTPSGSGAGSGECHDSDTQNIIIQ